VPARDILQVVLRQVGVARLLPKMVMRIDYGLLGVEDRLRLARQPFWTNARMAWGFGRGSRGQDTSSDISSFISVDVQPTA